MPIKLNKDSTLSILTIGWEGDYDFVFKSLGFQQFDLETWMSQMSIEAETFDLKMRIFGRRIPYSQTVACSRAVGQKRCRFARLQAKKKKNKHLGPPALSHSRRNGVISLTAGNCRDSLTAGNPNLNFCCVFLWYRIWTTSQFQLVLCLQTLLQLTCNHKLHMFFK